MKRIVQKVPESFVFDEGPTDEAIPGTKSAAKPSRDERRSCRRTVPQDRQSCELKVGNKVMSASLENMSDGGFSALIDCLDGLKIGKKIELRTKMGWFKVRIVYINQAARPKDAASECDSWFRLGMKIKQRLQKP